MSEAFESYASSILGGLEPLPLDEASIIPRELVPIGDLDSEIVFALRELDGELIQLGPVLPGDKDLEEVSPVLLGEVLEEEAEAIQNGVWRYGFEILGFYKSYRYVDRGPFKGSWGAFVLAPAVCMIREDIMAWYPGTFSTKQAATKALRLIAYHERYHFRFDAWALHVEEVAGKMLYDAYRKLVYENIYPHAMVAEESLANNHAYRSILGEGISEFVRSFMDSQPGAYRHYHEKTVEDHDGSEILRGNLCAQILNPLDMVSWISKEGASQEFWMRELSAPKVAAPICQDGMCPAYIVSGAHISQLIPPSTIGAPPLDELSRFIRRYLRGKQVRRTDHDYYVLDNGEQIRMPNPHGGSDRCKSNEFQGILRKAGMGVPDYRIERNRTRVWRRRVPRTKPMAAIV